MSLIAVDAIRAAWRFAASRRRGLFAWSAGTLAVALLGLMVYAFSLATLTAPSPTLLLLDRQDRFLAESADPSGDGYGYWPVQELPQRVVAATLALEDKRFWHHPGVDPVAMARALWQNLSSGERVSGASTLAMQVARMQNPGSRTYGRKLVESLTATFLTLRHGREAVLRHYLRLVPYGNNSHGIAYAARRYFDKPVADLSWAEIAFLSAIPQGPGAMNPYTYKGKKRAIRRGHRILAALRDKGVMDSAEHALATMQLNQLRIPPERQRPVAALHAIIKLEQELRAKPYLDRAGEPVVHTSLDLDLQTTVNELSRRALKQWRRAGAEESAVIVLKRESREVLSWQGSSGYFASGSGAIDFARVARSPGSALKPFVYALALERGTVDPGTVLYDLPAFANGFNNIDQRFLGPMLPRQALANSRNVPATRLVGRVGLDETYLFMRRLGLHDNVLPGEYYGLGIAVGTMPTTLERVVRAYGALADDGMLQDLSWLRGKNPAPSTRVLSTASARLITLFLSDPLARLPSFPRMGTTEYPFPVAVKTGTSQGYRDAWTVAYSRDYLVAVWVGRADARSMRKLGGAGSAADLAQQILLHLHEDQRTGMADLSFPAPPGYKPYPVCAYTGETATGLCEPTLTEWFAEGQPPAPDSRHLRLWVDRRTGLPASADSPREQLAPRTFMKIPAQLKDWADNRHIRTLPLSFSEDDLPLRDMLGSPDIPLPLQRVRQSEQPVRIILESPARDMHLYSNPEVPPAMNSIALRTTVEPSVSQVLWYVDGKPYQLAEPPYTVRWPLQKGRHTFQVRLPYRDEASPVTTVTVD